MIKAVFFDWFNTLARYEPAREELHAQAFREAGIEVSAEQLTPGLAVADREYFETNAAGPIRERPPQEQAQIYARYERTLLREAGVATNATTERFALIMKRVREMAQTTRFVLFDDVTETLHDLKQRGWLLGLLTNLDKDMAPILEELGLASYISVVVTSAEAGADKPQPPVFLKALEKARVTAAEAVHIGDQYALDVVGARGVGIRPVLLDRPGEHREVTDCLRIRRLTELRSYLDSL